ncbi:MAG: hypothetical protein HOC71_00930 [Candidatus Latescibacteria bacterium]|jgi:bifunctional oligoribonuclease and PAP phosphatase NrnA|nr:hypothetical protein [Candidatus Latescibacterota bacterium]
MIYFPENLDDWKKIALLIDNSENIVISTHVNPDGDAIGSEIALAGFFANMGKSFRIINHSTTPENLLFLDPQNLIETYSNTVPNFISSSEPDIVFFLDLGRYDRAGNIAEVLADIQCPKVIIDHHQPETEIADVLVVNSSAAAAGELLYDLMCHIDSSLLDKNIAFAIMTSLVSDTGFFRYSNTTSTTHLIASSLHKYGVKAYDVRRQLEKGLPFCRQKLLGLMLNTLKTSSNGRIAYAYVTEAMFDESGAQREHTEGIIDQIRYINDVKIAALIIQEGQDFYKVSFRSGGDASVNEIASALGGGGHKKAAGANLSGSLEEVISTVLKVVETYLKNMESETIEE